MDARFLALHERVQAAQDRTDATSSRIESLVVAESQLLSRLLTDSERISMLNGEALARQVGKIHDPVDLSEVEFSVFSQFGDDGIIQWLTQRLEPVPVFIEFGVEDYWESNTRFLLMHDNWSGLVLDGSERNVAAIQAADVSWRHDLKSVCAFITAENINDLIAGQGIPSDIGLLHIDLDGMDYLVWQALDVVRPLVLILEYNSVFGSSRAITVPYDPGFVRTKAHYSNLYQGASLSALYDLSVEKGYDFIGCNSAGNNAYFVRRDSRHGLKVLSVEEGYVVSKFAESRDEQGQLTHVRGESRIELIRGLPVVNTRSGELESL
jgi:hypothetical protein